MFEGKIRLLSGVVPYLRTEYKCSPDHFGWGLGGVGNTDLFSSWFHGLCAPLEKANKNMVTCALLSQEKERALVIFSFSSNINCECFNFQQILYLSWDNITWGSGGAVCHSELRKPWQLKRKNMDSMKNS